jgi:hypothetical protein
MRRILAILAVVPAALSAQRAIDLTGKPAASIEEPFTKISGVQELSPNLVVATDNMEAKVFLVDFARGTVKQLGAKGDGPNEYRYPSPPIAAPSGAWIFDTYQRRALLIGRDGAFTAMKMLPEGPLARPQGSDAAGRVYFQGSDFDMNTRGFSDTLPVVRWDPATDKVERVARVWGGGRVRVVRESGVASTAREITPFPNLDAWVALPDGRLALLRHEPFRIDFVSAGGVMTKGTPIATTPVAITARDRDWFRERNTPGRMSAITLNGGGGAQSQAPQWEDAHFPLTMPTFVGREVVTSPEGDIWIPRPFGAADRTRRYEIHDGTGKLVATATLDANSHIVGFGAKSVYVARVNPDDDLVYLMKYSR